MIVGKRKNKYNTHRIRRQVLDLELPREQGAAEQARRAAQLFQEQVLPKLDAVFSRLAPPGRILRIKRLEVDLSRLSAKRFEQEFVERCIQQIIRQVEAAAFDTVQAEETAAWFESEEENALAVLFYFLERGVLPWHAAGLSLKTLEETAGAAMMRYPSLFRQRSGAALKRARDMVLERLYHQFSFDFAVQLMEAMLNIAPGSTHQVLREQGGSAGVSPAAARHAAFFQVAARAAAGPKTQAAQAETAGEATRGQPGATERTQALASDHEAALRAEERLPPPIEAADQSKAPNRSAPNRPEAEGLPVDLAGLCLLAPYLPAFFQALGMRISAEQPEMAQRAAHLLHFLATGAEGPEEPVLALPKILCGLPLEMPVPQECALSKAEKTECRQLLEAVIRNWPALKNTSPAGLQGAFLQRAGLLYWKEERRAWLLRIERQSHDLLLERLPWSYSVLKLEWMAEMIQVEW
jgi:hypothetical protein